MQPKNIRDALPVKQDTETFEDILRSPEVRIERIVSTGQASPEHGWYDQDEHEWVMVVTGKAVIECADGSICPMSAGDYVNIPAHCRHRVSWTDPDDVTIWLAIFYK